MSLFREEVVAQRATNLHGVINLAVPVSWQLITTSLASILVVAGGLLASASYSRTETASGLVVPVGGILQVVPSRAGRVEMVSVREGQIVRKGMVLARIGAEETDRSGAGTQTAMLSAIDAQRRTLAVQHGLAQAAAASEQGQYQAQMSGFQEELKGLDAQLAVQRKLVSMAEADLFQASEIASRGFISKHDLADRQESLLSRQQQLAALQQSRSAKLAGIVQAERAGREAEAKAAAAASAIDGSQAQIERDQASIRRDQGYSLLAPADGQVAGLDLHVGGPVTPQEASMMIVPAGGRLIARFYVPEKAAGFVTAGQPVRLAVDAYPNDRFGIVQASIATLSSAPVTRTSKDGQVGSFYVATASIRDPFVKAYGRRQPLLPGMTLTARIVTARRSLIQWLFDPLFAASAA